MRSASLGVGASGSFSSATVVDDKGNKKQFVANTGSRMSQKSKEDTIALLRQIFDKFDKDKSGKINSFELDNILQSMNIQLTLESYNELLREFDKDGMGFKILRFLIVKIFLDFFKKKFSENLI